ncbi:galanin receptor type 1-like protein [Leptotrombidium deliense]|uniref:Galanin receptor type 1-like protein n=1 Tax=Leptotrombidium deliense TaxID=299467 RepID=A0A443SB46_9ACAR|nr:galanin receptor type 1-like protein [Leptotrombidium deliense]
MCVDKVEFIEINWIFEEIYENTSMYLEVYNWSLNNVPRFNAILTLAKVCGYVIMCLSIIGIIMNLVVITVLINNRKEGNTTTIFILSLAFSDIIIVLISGPLSTANLLYGDWALEEWFGAFGATFFCKIFHMFYTYSVIGSSFTLCFMTAERFFAIYYPLQFRKHRTQRKALKCVVGTWLFTTMITAPTLLYSDVKLTPTGCRRCYTGYPGKHFLNKLYYISWIDSMMTFYIPLTIITALNIAILVKITRMGHLWNKGNKSAIRRGNKTTIMIALIVCGFAVCWFPFQCLYLLNMIPVLRQKFPPEYLLMGYTLGFANSCLNPIIYSLLSEKFRKSCTNTYRKFKVSITITHSTSSTNAASKHRPSKDQIQTPL